MKKLQEGLQARPAKKSRLKALLQPGLQARSLKKSRLKALLIAPSIPASVIASAQLDEAISGETRIRRIRPWPSQGR